MARDSQRQRVYDSEATADHGRQFGSLSECQAFTDKTLQRKRLQTKFSGKNPCRMFITCEDGRGRNMAYATSTWAGGRVIKLPRWARTELTVLHEICHHLSPAISQHDWIFCSNLLTLVREMMGVEAYKALKAEYVKLKVRHKAPRASQGRSMTPERRQAATARLAAVRANREASKGRFVVKLDRGDGVDRWLVSVRERFGQIEATSSASKDEARVWAYESSARKWQQKLDHRWRDYTAEVVDLNEMVVVDYDRGHVCPARSGALPALDDP